MISITRNQILKSIEIWIFKKVIVILIQIDLSPPINILIIQTKKSKIIIFKSNISQLSLKKIVKNQNKNHLINLLVLFSRNWKLWNLKELLFVWRLLYQKIQNLQKKKISLDFYIKGFKILWNKDKMRNQQKNKIAIKEIQVFSQLFYQK